MNLDVTAVEKAEESIDAFIEKRARKMADANRVKEFRAEQDRREQARRRNTLRWEWADYHGRLHKAHLSIAEDHARRRALISEIPDFDADDVEARFDSIARGVPSREELLNTIG